MPVITLSLKEGSKHDFPFINFRKVVREVLKTEAKPSVFNLPEGPCKYQ